MKAEALLLDKFYWACIQTGNQLYCGCGFVPEMEVDSILEELRDVCLQYPWQFKGVDVGGRISLLFVHHVLHNQIHLHNRKKSTIEESHQLCQFSKKEFVDMLSEIFTNAAITNAHQVEIMSHIEALWRVLSSSSHAPSLTHIPITKFRFLSHMLQLHFPRGRMSEQSEYVDSRVRRLLRADMFRQRSPAPVPALCDRANQTTRQMESDKVSDKNYN